jgi:Chalcone isomerase-like
MRKASGRMLLAVGTMLAALGAGAAHGKECKGVAFPEQAQLDGSNLTLNGLGLRKAFLTINVYVAALYVAKPSNDPNVLLGSTTPSELILQFVRDVGAGDITAAWDEGFANNAKGQLPALKDRVAMLNGWMTDIQTGQRLTFGFKPGVGVTVNVNGTVKGTIKGDDFARTLLSIWLGADPPNPGIKTGLLGGSCG